MVLGGTDRKLVVSQYHTPTHVLRVVDLCDGGCLGDGLVHSLYEHPVTSRHSTDLNLIAGLRDPQTTNLREPRL